MKKITALLLAIIISLSLFGCSNDSSNPQPDSAKELKKEDFNEEQLKYANLTDELVDQKQDPAKGIDLYKKLVEILPVDNEYRQKLLRYLLDESQALIETGNLENVQKGLDLSLKLYEIIPGDFYVENRILGAYKKFAEKEMESKNWTKAKEWTQKGLRIRFDSMVMKTHLIILLGEAESLIKEKKYNEAKTNLEFVFDVVGLPENKDLFKEQEEKAQNLLKKIPNNT